METVQERAVQLFGESAVFDTALPQGWVDDMAFTINFDPRGHFVWLYEDHNIFGRPAPITEDGEFALRVYEKNKRGVA